MTMQGEIKFTENLDQLKEQRKETLEKLIQALREADQYLIVAQKGDSISISVAWETEDIPNMLDSVLNSLNNVTDVIELQEAVDSGTGPKFNT